MTSQTMPSTENVDRNASNRYQALRAEKTLFCLWIKHRMTCLYWVNSIEIQQIHMGSKLEYIPRRSDLLIL